MQERQAAWPDAIRSWWLDVGLETLQDQGITERHYQNKNIKERLLDAMAVPNIQALIEHARSMDGTDEDEVVKRLGLDPGTPNRWWKNEVQVHPRTFFGLLVIGLREEIHKIHFPSNRDVILEAVSRTVAIIREKECGGDRRCPSREELACVKLLVTHPHSDVLLGHHRNVSEEDIFKAVLRELRKRVPTKLIGSVADVRMAAAQWLRPYLLFRIGLLLEWGSSMAKPFESFEERILGISKERLDAADAELEAERNDPDFEPPAVEWLDDPDPFGMDWDWLLPRPKASPIASKTLAEPAASPTAPQIFGVPRRRVVTALAWAASILLVFSIDRFVLRPGGESDLDATGARVMPGGALGGQAWTLEVPSDRRAFVTVAVLGPDNVPEYYPEAGKLLEAQPGKPLTYTIQGNAGDSAFVILTETPARDLLHDKTGFAAKTGQQTWRDADSFRTFLEETLRSLGFRHFAVRRIVLTR